MQTFSKRVTIEPGFDPEFHFTKIYTINGVRFHVSVRDAELPYAFNMELKTWSGK